MKIILLALLSTIGFIFVGCSGRNADTGYNEAENPATYSTASDRALFYAEIMALQDQVLIAEQAIWPGLIEDYFIASLEGLGFEMTLNAIFRPIVITSTSQPNITSEHDVIQLLDVLFHLTRIGYDTEGIDIDALGYALEEAGLWGFFIEEARGRFDEKFEELAHYIALLEDLGVVIEYSFLDPGTVYGRISYFKQVWRPYICRITINPDAEFALASEEEYEMLAKIMEVFIDDVSLVSHGTIDISAIRQAVTEELWAQFEVVGRTVRQNAAVQGLREREQAVLAFIE